MRKRPFFLMALAFWLTAVGSSLLWNVYSLDSNTSELVRSVGRSFFKKIETTRLWNAKHGGVYVINTEDDQPEPYLQVPNQNLATTDGLRLTKINPALMTRQIAEIAVQESNVQYHLTSMNPIRPENKADDGPPCRGSDHR